MKLMKSYLLKQIFKKKYNMNTHENMKVHNTLPRTTYKMSKMF